jgi:calcineurin-like phosphoesterase family protein
LKLLIYSDLHLEFDAFNPKKKWFQAADLTVQVGDLHHSPHNIGVLKSWNTPVLFVPGNHDFWNPVHKRSSISGYTWGGPTHDYYCPYTFSLREAVEQMRDAAAGSQVQVLYNDSVVMDGVRFLGTTLWYDALSMHPRELKDLNDYSRMFNDQHAPIAAEDIQREHEIAKTFIADTLAVPFDGPTVLLTHHPARKIPGVYSPAYGTDLESIWKDRVALMVHGHHHQKFDLHIGTTRVVANPRGYPDDGVRSRFKRDLIVEV